MEFVLNQLRQLRTNKMDERPWIILDGSSLTMEQVMQLGEGKHSLRLSDPAWVCVDTSRAVSEVNRLKLLSDLFLGGRSNFESR